MFSIEPGELGPNLRQLGRTLADLSAIVVVSPHWQTQGVRVGATAMPETIHDFSGFPAPLYELQYTPPGAPALAAQRSEERRVGKECVSTCRSRWSPDH